MGHSDDNQMPAGWWFGTFFIFPCIGNVIIPTDELICHSFVFFREVFGLNHQAFGSTATSGTPAVTGWWFGTFFIFPYIGNVIIPLDSYVSERFRSQPPTISIDYP